ncbi:MAG: hypothetical protein EOO61_03335 [Hymenobacter sp.]|nr:MAG: hypothetical protein EOO61_03335 [Hymenobacter sp.]
MRLPEDITREIQSLDKTNLALRTTADSRQNDAALNLVLSGLTHRKMKLLAELEQSLITNNRHSLQYIFKTDQEKLEIKTLSTNLSAFGRLVDHQLGKATGGKHKHLPIYLNTIFSGSFGVQLSTPTESKFLDQDFEKAVGGTIDTLSELITATDIQLGGLVKETFAHDGALLNHFSSLLKNMALTGEEVEIRWRSPVTETIRTVSIAPTKASQLLHLFAEHATKEEEVRRSGIIKGVSLVNYVVEFVVDHESQRHIRADFDVALTDLVVNALNRHVTAQLLITTTYNEIKDKPGHTYRLLNLEIS